jgi:hypothetical protein
MASGLKLHKAVEACQGQTFYIEALIPKFQIKWSLVHAAPGSKLHKAEGLAREGKNSQTNRVLS